MNPSSIQLDYETYDFLILILHIFVITWLCYASYKFSMSLRLRAGFIGGNLSSIIGLGDNLRYFADALHMHALFLSSFRQVLPPSRSKSLFLPFNLRDISLTAHNRDLECSIFSAVNCQLFCISNFNLENFKVQYRSSRDMSTSQRLRPTSQPSWSLVNSKQQEILHTFLSVGVVGHPHEIISGISTIIISRDRLNLPSPLALNVSPPGHFALLVVPDKEESNMTMVRSQSGVHRAAMGDGAVAVPIITPPVEPFEAIAVEYCLYVVQLPSGVSSTASKTSLSSSVSTYIKADGQVFAAGEIFGMPNRASTITAAATNPAAGPTQSATEADDASAVSQDLITTSDNQSIHFISVGTSSSSEVEGEEGEEHRQSEGADSRRDAAVDGQEESPAAEEEGEDAYCVICLSELKEVLLLPCRHLCMCKACMAHVHTCPVCRAPSRDFVLLVRDVRETLAVPRIAGM